MAKRHLAANIKTITPYCEIQSIQATPRDTTLNENNLTTVGYKLSIIHVEDQYTSYSQSVKKF